MSPRQAIPANLTLGCESTTPEAAIFMISSKFWENDSLQDSARKPRKKYPATLTFQSWWVIASLMSSLVAASVVFSPTAFENLLKLILLTVWTSVFDKSSYSTLVNHSSYSSSSGSSTSVIILKRAGKNQVPTSSVLLKRAGYISPMIHTNSVE